MPRSASESATPAPRQVVVIGDQYAAGTIEGGTGPRNWTYDLQRLLGQAGVDAYVRNFGIIGSGYTPNAAVQTTFVDQINRGVNSETDAVIVLGGGNDMDSDRDLRDAVTATLEAVLAIAPQAQTVVVGPPWIKLGPPSGEILAARDAIRDSSEQFGARFIDPIADDWFTDRADLRGKDGVTVNNDAQPVIANRLEAPVLAALKGEPPPPPEWTIETPPGGSDGPDGPADSTAGAESDSPSAPESTREPELPPENEAIPSPEPTPS